MMNFKMNSKYIKKCIAHRGFIIAGILSVFWFLIRVVPKPSRAAYPCQRAAAPFSIAFLVWLAGACSCHLFFRKMRRIWHYSQSKFSWLLIAFGLILCLGIYLSYPAVTAEAGLSEVFVPLDNPNAPMGVPRGIFPGRVVWMHNPDATSWDGEHGHWWADANTNTQIVSGMLSRIVQNLAGESDDSTAWEKLFHHFNREYRNSDSGYQTGEIIAVKLNCVQNETHDDGQNKSFPSPQFVHALIDQLVHAGVPSSCIILYDATRFIPGAIFDRCKADFPEVRFIDWAGGDGRQKYARDSHPIRWSQPLTLEVKGGHTTYLASCLVESDYVINLAVLKGHDVTGITLCAKNHFGSLCSDYQGVPYMQAPQAAGLHPYVAVHDVNFGDPEWIFSRRPMKVYNPIVDLMGHKDAGLKTLLFLVDGLYAVQGQSVSVDRSQKWESAPFSGDWTSSLFASQDGVALESVCLDFMRNEPTLTRVYGAVDNYLHEAAMAHDPPSGVFYDPEDDSIRTPSLGVHEHWNNPDDRKYSVNLGTGPGIELLENPLQFSRIYPVAVFSEYGSFSGGGEYTEGEQVIVSLSSTSVQIGPGVRAVFQGWTGEGEQSYTGPDSVFTIVISDNVKETAQWRMQVFLSMGISPDSGGWIFPPEPGLWLDSGASIGISTGAGDGYTWAGWQGDAEGIDNPMNLIVDRPMSVTAFFIRNPVTVDSRTIPAVFSLLQNSPNPFNPSTTIRYDLSSPSDVRLSIHDMKGRCVYGFRNHQEAGEYSIDWNSTDESGMPLPSGVYVCTLHTREYCAARKMVLAR
jgi:hypothetical protein